MIKVFVPAVVPRHYVVLVDLAPGLTAELL